MLDLLIKIDFQILAHMVIYLIKTTNKICNMQLCIEFDFRILCFYY